MMKKSALARLLEGKPITQNIIGGAILQALWQGGSGVISFIAAHSAYINGLPLYWAISLGAGVFFVLALGAKILGTIVYRYKRIEPPSTSPLTSSSPSSQEAVFDQKRGDESIDQHENLKKIKRTDQTELEIRFSSDRRYQTAPIFRIGVYNIGNQVARDVETWLERMFPVRGYNIDEVLPVRLRTREANEYRCNINPDREELFEFIRTGPISADKPLSLEIAGLRIDPSRYVAGTKTLVLEPEAHLHFYLRVSCANAASLTAVFFLIRSGYVTELIRIV
jgi:hypothetical protein